MFRSLVILVAMIGMASVSLAAERNFPFDSELLLDAKLRGGALVESSIANLMSI